MTTSHVSADPVSTVAARNGMAAFAIMNAQDIALEREIDAAVHAMCMSIKRPECRKHWRRLCQLIEQRRPEVVREMELQRGLAQ